MLTQSETLTFERTIKAEAADVYKAFTTSQTLRGWLCDAAEVDPRKGGRIYLWWDDGYHSSGTFTDLVRDESLSFTWRGPTDPTPSEVRVSFTAKDGGTVVELQHSGLSSDEDARELGRGWESSLENLQSIMQTGIDLRVARRPMFGLNEANALDPETIERLSLPISEGLWLGGLIETMGAHKAGLQRDDVVVSLGGKPVTGFHDFRLAIEQHRAGDVVPIEFYRDGVRRTVDMELSSRPMPEIPTTLEELGERTRATYAETDKELAQLFEGVTDAEADYRPGADDWNAKEILAHLIAVERDIQTWIAGNIEDADVDNIFHSNGHERMRAIVASYPTLADITEELRREEAITAAMASTLPPRAFGNKAFYYQLASYLGTFADHHREHFSFIRGLIAAARG